MTLIVRARRLFFRLSSREKVLITAFVFTGIGIWAGAVLRGLGELDYSLDVARASLKDQQLWLDEAKSINSRLNAVLSRLKSDKTFTSAELAGKIDEIARRQEGVVFESFTPRTDSDTEFNLHSLRIRFRRASIGELLNFNEALKEEGPYITLESLRINANKSNPEQLDAQFVVSSFELKDNSLN